MLEFQEKHPHVVWALLSIYFNFKGENRKQNEKTTSSNDQKLSFELLIGDNSLICAITI